MDNLRVLRQVYDDYESERAMFYDKLSRTLNNVDISHDPVETVKGFVSKIAHLEHAQEVTVGFMTQIQSDLDKAKEQHSHQEEPDADNKDEDDDGTEVEDEK
jgi:hypothetical protein